MASGSRPSAPLSSPEKRPRWSVWPQRALTARELSLDWDEGLSGSSFCPRAGTKWSLPTSTDSPSVKLFIKPEPCTNRADEGPASPLA